MAKEKEVEKKKVKRPTALKRDLQSEKRRVRNRLYKSQVRTTVRQLDEILAKKDAELSKASLNEAYSILDKCVKAGVFKLNKASRTKARLAARVAAAKA
jgi:small subunit ribosomal protein S20